MKKLASVLLFICLTACSTELSHYNKTSPEFSIKNYFSGPVTGWGIVEDFKNKVTRRFCVDLIGTWQGNEGKLAEIFYFADGEITTRNWLLTQNPDGRYLGTAEDVVGTAEGQEQGFAFQWQYQLLVPVDDNIYQMSMDDWMYQIDEFKVFNRTSMSKFGVKLADITLFFDKKQPLQTCR